PAFEAADVDDIGAGFGDTDGDGADVGDRRNFHRDPRARIGLLQVEHELREVFDRIDVVVRRRRDQRHADLRAADAGDFFRHFGAGQHAALAGLGSLADLDADLVGVRQIARIDAEARRADLPDAAAIAFPRAAPIA